MVVMSSESLIISPSPSEDFRTMQNFQYLGLLKSFQKSNLPSSISIMLNFGTDSKHMLYDATNNEHDCLETQIWDPFSEVCRDVYCAADDIVYRLVTEIPLELQKFRCQE